MTLLGKEQMVSHRRSTTFSNVTKTSLRNPRFRISFQICSMGFISGVYGGMWKRIMFSIAIRHDKKASLTGQRFYRPIGIAILPDMVAGHTGTYPFLAPAVFRPVDSTKSGLILEHKTDFLPAVDNFQLFHGVINFFEAAISSSLAFWGCLLRGITFRHPWRCRTKYI